MKIIARKSTQLELSLILADLFNNLAAESWDIGFVFISRFSQESTIQLISEFQRCVSCKNFVGCSAAGVISDTLEIEDEPAVSLILMKFDQVVVRPFYFTQSELAAMGTSEQWYSFFDVYPNEKPKFFVFPDPFSIDINQFLSALNKAYDLCPVIGGLASGGSEANSNTLILNNNFYSDGCVGLSLQGDIRIETVVSQGCRPIGESFVVTHAQENIIYELGGRSFYKVLEEVLSKKASDRDRTLAQEALFIGIVMDEYKQEFKTGDFLIRPLIGLDQRSGAGAISDHIKTGQTVQFHVRDAISATHELTDLMDTQVKRHRQDQPQGALVFSCNGRGKNLFGVNNHDLQIIRDHVGDLPVGGFFCAGEIGPVGGQNFVHGFTSSIALFYPTISLNVADRGGK